jgi:hypothetical protein
MEVGHTDVGSSQERKRAVCYEVTEGVLFSLGRLRLHTEKTQQCTGRKESSLCVCPVDLRGLHNCLRAAGQGHIHALCGGKNGAWQTTVPPWRLPS